MIDFGDFAPRVQQSLKDALDSFVARDAEKADRVIEGDKEIDQINAGLFDTLIARVAQEPAVARVIIPLTSIARSLERIGDHAKNIAEDVVYMVRGRDVRHRGLTRKNDRG
jgi:phosphate transport system protein